jgi:hypothetical protein
MSFGTIGFIVAFAAGLIAAPAVVPVALANDAMPGAEQNALVQKHCAVCHNDASRNGGLSLEHFNASAVAPSLAAMMLSKLTSGVALETVRAAASDPTAAALVAKKLKGGAINAAGLPIPDMATIEALSTALALEATGAAEWHAHLAEDVTKKMVTITASILRELPSARSTGEAASYRLVLTCNAATHDGEMQLAWSPTPKTGSLSVGVDDKRPFTYTVEGSERMGDGSQGTPAGPAAINLRIPLPARTLTISNLFPNETVVFTFDGLTQTMRQALSRCVWIPSDAKY